MRKIFYVFEDDSSMLIYYQMLRRLAREFKLRTSHVEAIILYCFDFGIESMPDAESRPYKVEVEHILDVSSKELHRAVSRWARRFDEWLYFMRSRLKNPAALLKGDNSNEY